MAKVDWSYHRNGCKTCGKTQEFLSRHKIATISQQDARKDRIGPPEALELLEDVDDLFVTKGKRVMHFKLNRERPDDGELTRLLIGPSGNLRAPTVRRGRTLIVGFDEETYRNVFGAKG